MLQRDHKKPAWKSGSSFDLRLSFRYTRGDSVCDGIAQPYLSGLVLCLPSWFLLVQSFTVHWNKRCRIPVIVVDEIKRMESEKSARSKQRRERWKTQRPGCGPQCCELETIVDEDPRQSNRRRCSNELQRTSGHVRGDSNSSQLRRKRSGLRTAIVTIFDSAHLRPASRQPSRLLSHPELCMHEKAVSIPKGCLDKFHSSKAPFFFLT